MVPVKVRFVALYGLLCLCGFAAVMAFFGLLKYGPHHHRSRVRVTHVCVSPKCAKVGDHLSVVLDGTVSQVSEPQPGVVCVQVQARSHAGDFCVAA